MKNILSKCIIIMVIMSVFLTGCSSKNEEPVDTNKENVEGTENSENEMAFEGKYIVNADYVKENISNENILLIDARGEEAAQKGTIQGAIALKWQMLASVDGKPGDEMWGTVLPADVLSEKLTNYGIGKDKDIIIFGVAKEGWGDEGRILWELNMAGYENLKMVDGGYDALVQAGIETTKGASVLEPINVEVTEFDNSHNINTDELAANYDSFKVVDVRADEEYDGKTLYGEANGGHLPNAIHIKFTDLFNEDGMLKSNADIVTLFNENGITKDDKVVAYCTAGIRSAYMQLILEMCGFENTYNYDESYYRWCVVNDVQ